MKNILTLTIIFISAFFSSYAQDTLSVCYPFTYNFEDPNSNMVDTYIIENDTLLEIEYNFSIDEETGEEDNDSFSIFFTSLATESFSELTICDSYEWNGTTYTESGVYTFTSSNSVDCDSIATLNLTINSSSTSSEDITACDSFEWNGTTYTESGVYTFESENESGCTNVATLNLFLFLFKFH